jgi:hypothetical protein
MVGWGTTGNLVRRERVRDRIASIPAGRQTSAPATSVTPSASARVAMDAALLDVTVAGLHRLYDEKRYTVTQVVQWHLDRINRYNGVYGAIETLFRDDALALAAQQDAAAAQGGAAASRGALWGVPIVVKANTSIAGRVTTAGWEGFRRPGHELVAIEISLLFAGVTLSGQRRLERAVRRLFVVSGGAITASLPVLALAYGRHLERGLKRGRSSFHILHCARNEMSSDPVFLSARLRAPCVH